MRYKYRINEKLEALEIVSKTVYRETIEELEKRLNRHRSIISRHRYLPAKSQQAMTTDQLKVYAEVLKCRVDDLI